MLLIDMDMPNCCENCPICYDFVCCPITDTHMDYASMDYERLPNCPLSRCDTEPESPATCGNCQFKDSDKCEKENQQSFGFCGNWCEVEDNGSIS